MSKKFFSSIFLSWLVLESVSGQQDFKLWYKQPADAWTQALPVGNGRLGAMIFGRTTEELIQLNESTLWSGGPVKKHINPDAPSYLPAIRDALLKEEDYDKARMLTQQMQGPYTESYIPLANLMITQNFRDQQPSEYYRDLDIRNAVSTTRFKADGIVFTREIFATFPDQVIIIRMTADKPKQLNFAVNANSLLHYRNKMQHDNEIVMQGRAPAHIDPQYYNETGRNPVIFEDTANCNGMRFELHVKATSRDGRIRADSAGITVSNATEAILYLSAGTSFNGFDKCPDKEGKNEKLLAERDLEKALRKPFSQLLKDHLQDYQRYFNRVSFELKDTAHSSNASLPSDKRLLGYSRGAYDPGMEVLYFNFARYLLISSSRPGGPPANLQGIWNMEMRPPWSSNYTININTQMNYWLAETTNLSDLHLPLLELIKNLSLTGKTTAREFYNLQGWVAHHNTDIWALSNPVGDKGKGEPKWANWNMSAPWLCQHLWEHYWFTGNKYFLKDTAYPLMKGAAEFCLGWLVKDKNGYLVTAPSMSPENDFYYAEGKTGSVSVATTMDMSIIWDLFTNLIEASKVLNIDSAFSRQLIEAKNKLYPMHIGRQGNLLEWYKDWDDVDPQHRHVSHLFGLHPGHQISPELTPELARAAKRTLEIRGDGGTGWSKAWKINFWARLLDGDHAYLLLRQLLHATGDQSTDYSNGGGTYPDFFDAHPPFQIDGNFGAAAGIAEMLVQSHLNEINLLPALPSAWKEGKISGLRARGGYEVNLNWKDHRLTKAEIKATRDGLCHLKAGVPLQVSGIEAVCEKTDDGFALSFLAKAGSAYIVHAL